MGMGMGMGGGGGGGFSRMWRDSGGGGGVGGGVKYNMSESASVKRRSELNEFMHNTKTQ